MDTKADGGPDSSCGGEDYFARIPLFSPTLGRNGSTDILNICNTLLSIACTFDWHIRSNTSFVDGRCLIRTWHTELHFILFRHFRSTFLCVVHIISGGCCRIAPTVTIMAPTGTASSPYDGQPGPPVRLGTVIRTPGLEEDRKWPSHRPGCCCTLF